MRLRRESARPMPEFMQPIPESTDYKAQASLDRGAEARVLEAEARVSEAKARDVKCRVYMRPRCEPTSLKQETMRSKPESTRLRSVHDVEDRTYEAEAKDYKAEARDEAEAGLNIPAMSIF